MGNTPKKPSKGTALDQNSMSADKDVSAPLADKQSLRSGMRVLKELSLRIERSTEKVLDRTAQAYAKWRLDSAAKRTAYLTYCGKTKTWHERLSSGFIGFFLEIVTIVLGLIFVWFNGLFFFLKAETIDLEALKPHAAQFFNERFAGQSTDMDKLRVQWIKGRKSLALTAENVRVDALESGGADQQSQTSSLLEIPHLMAEFDLESLLFGRFVMTQGKIEGGTITAIRNSKGELSFGLGRPDNIDRFGALLKRQDNENAEVSSKDVQTRSVRAGPIQRWRAIKKVEIGGAQAFIIDQKDGLNWQLDDLDLTYISDDKGRSMTSTSHIISRNESVPFAITVLSNDALDSFEGQLSLDNFKPADLAPQRGSFAVIRRLDAPVRLSGQVKAVAGKGVTALDLDINAGQGELRLESGVTPFSSAQIMGQYDVAAQALNIKKLNLQSERFKVNGQANITDIGSLEKGFLQQPIQAQFDLSSLYLDLGENFDAPHDFTKVSGLGQYSFLDKSLSFEGLEVVFDGISGEFAGDLALRTPDTFSDIPIEALNITGQIAGPFSKKHVLGKWPNTLGLGARSWISNRVEGGVFSNLNITANIPFSSLLRGHLSDEDLRLTFDIYDGQVRYLSTMTPLYEARGRGTLLGNSFYADVEEGRIGTLLKVDGGRVEMAGFMPKGNNMVLRIDGSGPVENMLSLIDEPPLNFAAKSNVNPSDFKGHGTASLLLTRPMRSNVPNDKIGYAVKGMVSDVQAPSPIGNMRISDGAIDFYVDRAGLEMSGPIKLGQWQANFNMDDRFDGQNTPAEYIVNGVLSRDDLDRLGIGLREYFDGFINLSLKGLMDDGRLIGADMSADLTGAGLKLGDLWSKNKGEGGTLQSRILFAQDQLSGANIKDVVVLADGLEIGGALTLAPDLKLLGLDFPVFKIESYIDSILSARTTQDGRLQVDMKAQHLNISPWSKSILTGQNGRADSLPLILSASVDTLVITDELRLKGASVAYQSDEHGVINARLEGQHNQRRFLTQIIPNDVQSLDPLTADFPERELSIDVENAGLALSEFYGVNNIRGGALRLRGTLPPRGIAGPLTARAQVSDFKLVNAHIFARILSLASLQGLGEILSGDGMNFDSLDMPFSYDQGVLDVSEATASGSALGLTVMGSLNFRKREADLNGVIVPAYTFNSLLGGIPILGDIVVGRKGEGIFALKYSVKGAFEETQVSVNPLSALAPGFLRQIFEPTANSTRSVSKGDAPVQMAEPPSEALSER